MRTKKGHYACGESWGGHHVACACREKTIVNEDLKAAPVTDAEYLRLLAERLRGGFVSILTLASNPTFIADRLEKIAKDMEK